MCSFSGPSLGVSRTTVFLSGGIALDSACRTIRRCTPCFVESPWIVSPAAYPRRITSNSSIFCLLSIPESLHPGLYRWANLDERSGPIQMSELN